MEVTSEGGRVDVLADAYLIVHLNYLGAHVFIMHTSIGTPYNMVHHRFFFLK